MTMLLLLLACTPDCEDGFGFADGECVPIDRDGTDGPISFGGGRSASVFYERLVARYCMELRRCASSSYQVDALCEEIPSPSGYSYGDEYATDLIGCTVDTNQANLCIGGDWTCVDFGNDYVTVQLPQACYTALDAQCGGPAYYTEPTYYGYYEYY